MKKIIRKFTAILTAAVMTTALIPAPSGAAADDAAETRRLIELVNDYWISRNQNSPSYGWADAAYFVGNTQAYLVTGIEYYHDFAVKWGDSNHWSGPEDNNAGNWDAGGVFHADNQTCFQTYLDMYFLDGDRSKMARPLEVMGSQIHTAPSYYWTWDDAIFMAMPAMSRLYRATGDRLYADKLWEYFAACRDELYNSEYRLFFRDAGYINDNVQGQRNFWARGNGWVMAALAQTLRDMPEDWEHYGEMLAIYRDMAAGATACMKDDGAGNKYWTQSMLPKYPVSAANPNGYETSGTAFMTYALMYGINAGLLDSETYLPYAMGGINYLKNVAIQPSGRVGYVQEVGSAATSATAQSATQNFGVGATLLALCELYKYQGGLSGGDLLPYITWRTNNTAVMRLGGGNMFYGGNLTSVPAPYEENGEIWLPLRAIAETFGYTVEWDDGGYASVAKEGRVLTVTPGAAASRINGVRTELPAAPVNRGGTIYLSTGAAAKVFDLRFQRSGDLLYLGYKLNNFLPCEASAELMLDGILSSGTIPARPEQPSKDLGSILTETSDGYGIDLGDASQDSSLIDDVTGGKTIPIKHISAASVPEPENPPENAIDRDINTRYAAIAFNAVFDLGEVKPVTGVALSFWQYDSRTTKYELAVSADGENYTTVYDGSTTLGREFDIRPVNADIRYIRVIGHGSSNGTWTSLLEIAPFV